MQANQWAEALHIDTLARNFKTNFTERLSIEGAGFLLYNDKSDMVSVKRLDRNASRTNLLNL
jgi:hypothetical protein